VIGGGNHRHKLILIQIYLKQDQESAFPTRGIKFLMLLQAMTDSMTTMTTYDSQLWRTSVTHSAIFAFGGQTHETPP